MICLGTEVRLIGQQFSGFSFLPFFKMDSIFKKFGYKCYTQNNEISVIHKIMRVFICLWVLWFVLSFPPSNPTPNQYHPH